MVGIKKDQIQECKQVCKPNMLDKEWDMSDDKTVILCAFPSKDHVLFYKSDYK